jgi:YVTN family beta-propeller protein
VQRIPIANPGNATTASIGGLPVVVAVDAAGQFAYTTHMSPSMISVIDVASMTKVAEVPIPGEAHALAVSPRGDRVYVTNTSNSVFAVDVASRTIVGTSTVGAGPWGIAFWTTATDSLMYVSARNGGSLSEIDMRTGNVLRTIHVGGRPHGVAISPDGSTLYTADDSNGEIVFVNRGTGTVTARLSAQGAWGVALSPDGNTLFVTTNYGYIVVVDVPSATITKRYWADSQPREIFVMPDNRTAMAANMGGWIDVVTR